MHYSYKQFQNFLLDDRHILNHLKQGQCPMGLAPLGPARPCLGPTAKVDMNPSPARFDGGRTKFLQKERGGYGPRKWLGPNIIRVRDGRVQH